MTTRLPQVRGLMGQIGDALMGGLEVRPVCVGGVGDGFRYVGGARVAAGNQRGQGHPSTCWIRPRLDRPPGSLRVPSLVLDLESELADLFRALRDGRLRKSIMQRF
jgi:hypothetical protein